ncbi:TolC family protein [Roseococcus sp. SYP-B2431]|uniref:TolC family protein n=1 Tax=Roseococcus sp. SYP-B2431 TaxID=2496640 RepID=UPI0010403181|nr:TolC family protein [Roseococcus sp. SYP-B2431]TCH99600.1 TolC family protein [Roseococcus sp. SYP-B2431]
MGGRHMGGRGPSCLLPAILGVVLAASGAAAQPRERAPRTAAPAAPPSTRNMPEGSVPLTLPEAVFLAIRSNRSIRSQYLQRVADRFSLRVAEARFDPQYNIGASTNRTRLSGVTTTTTLINPTATILLPTGAQFTFGWQGSQSNIRNGRPQAVGQATFQVIQPLLAGAGIDYNMAPTRIARLQEIGSQLQLKALVIDQISQTILGYRALLQAQEQLRISDEALRRARELASVNVALAAAGRIAQVELIQAETSIAQQELALVGARNAQQQARLALLTLLAVNQSQQIWAVERPAADSARVPMERALNVAADNQPDYLRSILAIEVSRINLDVARNQRLWDLSLVAGSAAGSQTADIARTLEQLSSARNDFNIGLRLNIPLGQIAREAPEVQATIGLRQAEIARDAARDRLRQQVEDTVRNIDALRRQAELARRARELAGLQLETELVKLQAGRSSNFQVVSFQGFLQAAESAELAAVIAYANSLTQLDQVLGTTLDTWRIALND